MPFWNIENPLKPWGYFDPNAELDIPFDWSAWLTEVGETHASHVIVLDPKLDLISSAHSAGIITAFVKVKAGEVVEVGAKYPVTCRITTTGAPPRVDDRTVYLKMVER